MTDVPRFWVLFRAYHDGDTFLVSDLHSQLCPLCNPLQWRNWDGNSIQL